MSDVFSPRKDAAIAAEPESGQTTLAEAHREELLADIEALKDTPPDYESLEEDTIIETALIGADAALSEEMARYDATLRGWYGQVKRPRWCPKQSKFGARGGKHAGVDIAALKGTELLSLVKARMTYVSGSASSKIGNRVWLEFRYKKQFAKFVYGHLDGKIGKSPRNVVAGEKVGTAGCSGNTTYCGNSNCLDRREDHVHVALYLHDKFVDPVPIVGWKLRYYDDNDCEYYDCP